MTKKGWLAGGAFVAVAMATVLFYAEVHVNPSPQSTHRAKIHPQSPAGMAMAGVERKQERYRQGLGKSPEPDGFFRYHHAIRRDLNNPSRSYAPNYRMRAYQEAEQAGKASTRQLDWVERGPGNVSGRTRGLIVDPDDPTHNTWYAGSVGGGVWKTTDAGASWEEMTKDLANLATVSIAQAVSDTDVLYVGTGEGFGNVDAVNGDGIWKSTDRGATWTQLASTANTRNFQAVNRLLVDPTDADIVVAATNQGVFRTIDGGTTWTRTFARPVGAGDGRLQQVVASPDDFNILYASANAVGIYKSLDAGQTWRRVLSLQNQGSRAELAVAPSDPSRVYVAVYNFPNSDLYLSDDTAATWVQVPEAEGDAPAWMGGQGWYDNTIAVHPFDPRVVFVGGINLWRMDVTGNSIAGWERTTTMATNWFPGLPNPEGGEFPFVHADHHNLITIPLDETEGTFRLLNANDGGVEYTEDGGETWTKTLNGYNTSQFYGADKRPGADEYIGGMQDNGTWRSPSGVSSTASTEWLDQLGGDGFEVAWHAEDPLQIMGSSQFNSLLHTFDGGETWSTATEGLLDVGNDGNFITGIAKSQSDPDLLFTTGSRGVWRTDSFGRRWTLGALTNTSRWFFNGLRVPAAISIADPQVVWAGARMSNAHSIFVSTDGGLTFAPTSTFPNHGAEISGLVTHPLESETAYALFSAPDAPKVLRTLDQGATWENLSGAFAAGAALSDNGFPNVATYALLVMPYNPDEIWVGTEIGLFISTNGGASWDRADNGLPAVSIWQLRIVDDQVVVATHGRGVWSASLTELADYEPPVVTLTPRINSGSLTPLNNLILDLSLRSVYDSANVYLDDEVILKFDETTTVKDTTLSFPFAVAEAGTVSASIVAYQDERVYRSSSTAIAVFPIGDVQSFYLNDFEWPNDDFFGTGFQQMPVADFDSRAIHSTHPYPNQRTLLYQLRVPIQVAAEDATLRYRDVAIIEPGEPDVPFGEDEFWDYVVVEGSRNGLQWVPLADGYDARAHASWQDAYDNELPGTGALMVQQEIDLLDTFDPGDVIFIRFRLFADSNVNSWGWAIDDVAIQEALNTATEDEGGVPEQYVLGQNYPNPFTTTTAIPFSLPSAASVSLKVYDVQGRLVATLLDGMQPSGQHTVSWNASDLASGMYFYRLEQEGTTLSRSLMLVK